jgi:hypothetical protein
MRLKDLLIATICSEKGTILFQGIQLDEICFIGSTMPASVSPGSSVNNFTVTPIFAEVGIIAVSILTYRWNSKHGNRFGALVKITNTDEGIKIDFDTPFQLSADRLGGVRGCILELTIAEKKFSTSKYIASDDCHYLEPNLACRYLAGLASKEEVLAAVAEQEAETSAQEQLAATQTELKMAQAEIARLRKQTETMHNLYNEVCNAANAQKIRAEAAEAKLGAVINEKLAPVQAKAWELERMNDQAEAALERVKQITKGSWPWVSKQKVLEALEDQTEAPTEELTDDK